MKWLTMKERILEISKENNLSHLGSCVGMAEVLGEVYETKKPEDIVVLDGGHAGLALYVAMEKYEGLDAEQLFKKHGVHPNKDDNIPVSSGSLGLAGSIALGMAIANPNRDVYCLTTDGAVAEGIWWETLRIKADKKIDNFKVYVNANGWSAYGPVDIDVLEQRLHAFDSTVQVRRTNSDLPHAKGLDSHYRPL